MHFLFQFMFRVVFQKDFFKVLVSPDKYVQITRFLRCYYNHANPTVVILLNVNNFKVRHLFKCAASLPILS